MASQRAEKFSRLPSHGGRVRPATRTGNTCRRPDGLWRGQGGKGQAPGSAEGPGRVFWLGLTTAGQSPGGYPCKELIGPCLVTRVGRKGGSEPLNSQLFSMCCAPGCQVRIPERPQRMQGAAASAEGPATPVQDSPYHPPRPLTSFGFNVIHFEVGIWSILKARIPGVIDRQGRVRGFLCLQWQVGDPRAIQPAGCFYGNQTFAFPYSTGYTVGLSGAKREVKCGKPGRW